ncbi:MAG: hypothetical protein KAR38_03220, partial [Calditrichia bacterium]|nr:hypothetical protein [Calditrichia bacterium]
NSNTKKLISINEKRPVYLNWNENGKEIFIYCSNLIVYKLNLENLDFSTTALPYKKNYGMGNTPYKYLKLLPDSAWGKIEFQQNQ